MATIQRPLKEGSVRTYQEKVGLGFLDILASEMDADLATIFDAWNGGADTINIKDGSITAAKLATDAKPWTLGTTIFPTDASKVVALGTTTTNPLQWGALTAKGHLVAHPSNGFVYVTNNATSNAAGTAWAQDTTALPSWIATLNVQTDGFLVSRIAAAATTPVTFMTLDAVGSLTLHQGSLYAYGGNVLSGAGTIKGFVSTGSAGDMMVGSNSSYGPNDTTKSSWYLYLNPAGDIFQVYRRAPNTGGGAGTSIAAITNDGSLVIVGNNATKNTGTLWINPSDPRLKRDVTPYTPGLDAIRALAPITFKWNGRGGTVDDDRVCYGLDASAVTEVLPECVGRRLAKLDPDDETETELLTLDASNILWALVNAVRELAGRVAALEAPA